MTDKQREEWIEKKVRQLHDNAYFFMYDHDRNYENIRKFIRTLLNEAPKPKVSKEKAEQLEDDFRNDYVSLENTIIEAIKLGGGEVVK